MQETYVPKNAMERLRIKSKNAFRYPERKHPEAFVIVNEGIYDHTLYEKAAFDRFAEERKQEKP